MGHLNCLLAADDHTKAIACCSCNLFACDILVWLYALRWVYRFIDFVSEIFSLYCTRTMYLAALFTLIRGCLSARNFFKFLGKGPVSIGFQIILQIWEISPITCIDGSITFIRAFCSKRFLTYGNAARDVLKKRCKVLRHFVPKHKCHLISNLPQLFESTFDLQFYILYISLWVKYWLCKISCCCPKKKKKKIGEKCKKKKPTKFACNPNI